MQASAVLLPQPEGPSSVRNSPLAIARSSDATAVTPPKCLLSPCNITPAMPVSLPLERARQHAAHEVALERERDHHGRQYRHHARREHRPVVVEAKLHQE